MFITPENIYENAVFGYATANRVLQAQHRFFSLLRRCGARDSRTGDIVPVALFDVLFELSRIQEVAYPVVYDRFADILSFAADSLMRIIDHPRSMIMREVEMTPVQKASRLSAAGVAWLNRQPGATKRQKLQNCREGIPAIQRRFSLDTAENRLVKKFARDVSALLGARESAFGSPLPPEEDRVLMSIIRWLREDDVLKIRHQMNAEVNNAILGDADYNRVWRAWNRMGHLEEQLTSDCNQLVKIETCHAFWYTAWLLKNRHGAEFPQQACFPDEELLLLHPGFPGNSCIIGFLEKSKIQIKWQVIDSDSGVISLKSKGHPGCRIIVHEFNPEALAAELERVFPLAPVPARQSSGAECTACVIDFCSGEPWYAHAGDSRPLPLPFSLLQQYVSYQTPDKAIEFLPLSLAECTCAWFSKSVSWMSIKRLLDSEYSDLHKNNYALYVAEQLRERLRPEDNFVYLLPDTADEFSLRLLNSTMARQFAQAMPLPASVATALGYGAAYKCEPGTVLFIIERSADNICITPMEAEKQDPELGMPIDIVWVKHPVHVLESDTQELPPVRGICLLNDFAATQFINCIQGRGHADIKELSTKLEELEQLPIFKDKKHFIRVEDTDSVLSARGGDIYRTHTIQCSEVKGATLWRHHLPPLLAEFEGDNCLLNKLTLVGDATTINPRVVHCQIPIADKFTLRAGCKDYSFRLTKGKGHGSSKYEMYLHSSMFPLIADETCSLELYYSYGAAEPYEMYFVCSDASWRAKVEWREARAKREPGEVPDAPLIWSLKKFEQIRFRYGKESTLQQLLKNEWQSITKCLKITDFKDYIAQNGWVLCEVNRIIPIKNGNSLIFFCDATGNEYCVFENQYKTWQDAGRLPDIEEETEFYVLPGKYSAEHNNYRVRELASSQTLFAKYQRGSDVPTRLFFQWVIEKLWNGGRCCGNGIPNDISEARAELSTYAEIYLNRLSESESRIAALSYFLCMGVDAPPSAVKYMEQEIIPNLQQKSYYTWAERRVFLAIGDGQCDWQKKLFRVLLSKFERNVEPHRFWILSRVLWRDSAAVNLLDYDSTRLIINNMCNQKSFGKSVYKQGKSKNDVYVDPWYASAMEIMLALLRLRGSDNVKLQNALALNSPLISRMYGLFQNLLGKLADENAYDVMRSRLEISLPEQVAREISVPPLIYLLRCYLTGVHTPAGITVEEISDDDL